MKTIRFAALAFLSAGFIQIAAGQSSTESGAGNSSADIYRIFGGSRTGGFNTFIRDMSSAIDDFIIVPVDSEGGPQNLERLAERGTDVQFALSQNDLAYNTYHGQRNTARIDDFEIVLPLYRNYQQVFVRIDSTIDSFDDLNGATIATGETGSASSLNAADVLEQRGIESEAIAMGTGPALTALNACDSPANCEIDAVILTGGWRQIADYPQLRRIPVPEAILNELTEEYAYYSIVSSPGDDETGQNSANTYPTLSTTTYLLTHPDVADERVEKLTRALIDSWDDLSELRKISAGTDDLVDLRVAVLRRPFPFHNASQDVLVDLGMVSERFYFLWGAGFVVGILLLSFFRVPYRTYDRLGHATTLPWTTTIRERAGSILFGAGFGRRLLSGILYFIMAVLVVFLLIVACLAILEWIETAFGRSGNDVIEFSLLGFWESLIWVFTWMATGYEGENFFPASQLGRFWAALIGVVGVGAPLLFLYKFIADRHSRAARRERGESDYALRTLKDHTLVCGWNSKVPGLIYALTGKDSPEKLHVVVVAEMDEDYPLRKYRFDSRFVSYCRGDSADYKTLKRARSEEAKNAVIVAGEKNVATLNAGSALTAIALKSTNEDIMLVGEVSRQSNVSSFHFSDVDGIVVNGPDLSEQLIALALNNPNIIDFILDMLTYDEFTECNSRSVSAFGKFVQLHDAGITAAELFGTLHASDINLLSIRTADSAPAPDNRPALQEDWNMLMTRADHDVRLKRQDEVVFICDDVRHLERHKNRKSAGDLHQPSFSGERLFSENEQPQSVLFVGDRVRAERIAKRLGMTCGMNDVIETPKKPRADDENELKALEQGLESGKTDSVIFLNSATGLSSVEHDVSFLGDAQVVIRCKLAKVVAERIKRSIKIVAEIHQFPNVVLLQNIGVDTVIPTDILVQRFLSKPMFDRGNVTRLFAHLMDVRRSYHLRSLVVPEPHALITKKFSDVLRTVYADGRVIACVPKSHTEALRNRIRDFRTHFKTTSGQLGEDVTLSAGDLIIAIVSKSP